MERRGRCSGDELFVWDEFIVWILVFLGGYSDNRRVICSILALVQTLYGCQGGVGLAWKGGKAAN